LTPDTETAFEKITKHHILIKFHQNLLKQKSEQLSPQGREPLRGF